MCRCGSRGAAWCAAQSGPRCGTTTSHTPGYPSCTSSTGGRRKYLLCHKNVYLSPHVSPDLRTLEVPALLRSQDRVRVLDLLYNLGTPHGHQAATLKLKMFESQNISVEESYILKRVLRGFRQLRSLLLWRVCDDAMLQILGVTCHHLTEVSS